MGCGKSKKSEQNGKTQNGKKGVSLERKNENNDLREKKVIEAKIVLLGETGVGKSSIALRYCHNKFSEAHEVTIGGAYLQQNVTLSNNQTMKLHIWDTGGSERFRAMIPLYYRDAAAAIITYDVTQEKSFKAVKYWVDELTSRNEIEKIVVALAANKCDITPYEKKYTITQGKQFADENSMIFSETSAKSGQGISELFKNVAQQIYQNSFPKPNH